MIISVVSDGAFLETALSAVVTLLSSKTFDTLVTMAVIFSVIFVSFLYIKTGDLAHFFYWFFSFFVIIFLLLGVKVDVHIEDTSNPSADYNIDNVPYGIALPASVLSNISIALAKSLEHGLNIPDELSYTTTGLFFSLNLMSYMTSFYLIDSQLRQDLSNYIHQCVLNDILVSNKYTLQNLKESTDISSLIFNQSSLLRGIYLNKEFNTCREAGNLLKIKTINSVNYVTEFYAKKLISNNENYYSNFNYYIENTYNIFFSQQYRFDFIVNQIIMINAIKSSLSFYFNSNFSIKNSSFYYQASQSIINFLKVSYSLSLSLLFVLFPVLMMLCLQRIINFSAVKNYLMVIIWIETWPLAFSLINIIVSYYAIHQAASLAKDGLSLLTVDALVEQYTLIEATAGYAILLIISVFFLIIKNLSNYWGQLIRSFSVLEKDEQQISYLRSMQNDHEKSAIKNVVALMYENKMNNQSDVNISANNENFYMGKASFNNYNKNDYLIDNQMLKQSYDKIHHQLKDENSFSLRKITEQFSAENKTLSSNILKTIIYQSLSNHNNDIKLNGDDNFSVADHGQSNHEGLAPLRNDPKNQDKSSTIYHQVIQESQRALFTEAHQFIKKEFTDYVQKVDPLRAKSLLQNISSQHISLLREAYIESYVAQLLLSQSC